jgi:hypothetical protein
MQLRTKKFVAYAGDGFSTVIDINHGLGTIDFHVSVFDAVSGAVVYPDIICNLSYVRLTFLIAPTTNKYRVIVIG